MLESHDGEQLQNPEREMKPYLQASLSKTHYSCDLTLWDVSRILVTDCRVTARDSVWSNDSEWNKRRQVAHKPRNLVRQTPICNKFVLKFVCFFCCCCYFLSFCLILFVSYFCFTPLWHPISWDSPPPPPPEGKGTIVFFGRGCAAGYLECCMLSLYQTFNSLLACVQPPPSLHQLYTG